MSSIPAPLAERLRPESLDQLVGQKHLTGKGQYPSNSPGTGQNAFHDPMGTTGNRQNHDS